jgi:hypothetical protein
MNRIQQGSRDAQARKDRLVTVTRKGPKAAF